MNLSEEDRIEYAKECEALKKKYGNKQTLAYRRESSALGYKYKQREIQDETGTLSEDEFVDRAYPIMKQHGTFEEGLRAVYREIYL